MRSVLLAILCLAVGCGGSGPAPCRELGEALCLQACDCGEPNVDSECITVAPTQEGGTAYWGVNPSACRAAYEETVCGGTSEPDTLFAGCLEGLRTAQCVQEPGTGDWVLELPLACRGVLTGTS